MRKHFSHFSALVFAAVFGQAVEAQTVLEENSPPQLRGEQLSRLPGEDLASSNQDDDTPLGTDIVGLKIISSPDEVLPVASGKDVIIDRALIPDEIDLALVLETYIGQPLSLKILTDIRNDIVRAYRESGRAFVSATIPPQEVSKGVIQIIVTESRLEAKQVDGNLYSPDEYILSNIGAEEGETVDTDQLISDINWLNLNPYRNLVVIAEPGKEFGGTVLTFKANERKPWTLYAGYNNHGTESTDENRFFAGFHVANLPAVDHQLSYQITGSNDAFKDQDLSTLNGHGSYLSHDGYYFIPTSWRHKIRLRGAYIETRSNLTGGLVSENTTSIFSFEYAIPMQPTAVSRPEFYAQFEHKNSNRDIFSGGILASNAQIDVNQINIGLRGYATDEHGKTDYDFRWHHSPGGISDFDNAVNYAAFSGVANADAQYSYLYGSLQRTVALDDKHTWFTELATQWTNESLPSTEAFSIGGANSVRGYRTSENDGDRGIIFRNELHFDQADHLNDTSLFTRWDAFLFGDTGYVDDIGTGRSENMSSIGIGLNADLGDHLSFGASLGFALTDAATTKEGDARLDFNVNVRF